ncbi:hypothetical protein ACNTMW_10820 [Planosporangium sp. 12N6]|uniref:hypothetical protein n=1 Tax=Planosporangium spinosum TaxID=3402278 RepID=UPI003CEF07F3
MPILSGHRRTAGAAVVAALVAGPVLVASAAYAAEGQRVDFTGGSVLGLVVCRSEPSVARLAVPAESRVVFINRLGQPAMLRVDGRPVVRVGANQAAPVVFHHGPVSVSMTFACGAGVMERFSPVSVSVTAARAATPAPSTTPPPTTGPTVGVTGGAPVPTRGGATGRPVASPARAARGTATAGPGPVGAPTTTPSPTTGPSTEARPATGGVSPGPGGDGNSVAVQPVVTASGATGDSASGPLALFAAICVIGVTVAVTRAIISKRTNQARYA